MQIPLFMTDLVLDRLVSRRQIVQRYGNNAYWHIARMLEMKWVERHDHLFRGQVHHCYHLSRYGRTHMAEQTGTLLREVPYTPGFKNHTVHTLLVGEVRYRLAQQGYVLQSEYSLMVEAFIAKERGPQADLYVLESDNPVVAVEIDRGYSEREIRWKIDQWKRAELEVWWFADSAHQYEKVQGSHFPVEALYNLNQLGWDRV